MSFRQSLAGIMFVLCVFSSAAFAAPQKALYFLTKNSPPNHVVATEKLEPDDYLAFRRASRQLQNVGLPQPIEPILETSFFWKKLSNQFWELNLYVKDQPVDISAMTLYLVWSAKSYLETIISGPNLLPNPETNALDWYSMPLWYEDPGTQPIILNGYTIYPDGNGGYNLFLSSFTRRVSLKTHNQSGLHFAPRKKPYVLGQFQFVDGNSYMGWINNPKVFFHSTVSTNQANYQISSRSNLNHPNFHMVDANQDNEQDFADYEFMWNYFFTRTYVANLSMYQYHYDPRFDADEDCFMNFLDLRFFGKRLNRGRYVGDANNDGAVNQEDENIVSAHIGSVLFQADGSYDIHFPWFADLNGDLEVNQDDFDIVSQEFGQRYF